MFGEDPPKTSKVDVANIQVTCDACETETRVSKLTKRDNGDFECPECGAPVEVGKETKKALKESTGSTKAVEKSSMVEPKVEKKTGESKSQTGIFCAECGAQWIMLHGKTYAVCGHKTKGVEDPSMAKRINPPAGLQRPTVKKVRILFPQQMFRVSEYNTFRTPDIELEAEIKEGEDYQAIKATLLEEAKNTVNKEFVEIYSAYMEKLEFIHKDFQSRE